MRAEPQILLPLDVAEQAGAVFSAALRRYVRDFGSFVHHTSDLARNMFMEVVAKQKDHPRFAELFPVEGPDLARLYLAQVDLAFRKKIKGAPRAEA